MVDETVDLWETESGLPGNFDATVNDAGFLINEQYGNLVIDFELSTDDPEIGNDGVYNLRVSCGDAKPWEIQGRGDSVRHVSGRDKQFNQNSAYGVFLRRAVKLAPEVMRSRGTPDVAKIWNGTMWHFDREVYKVRDKDTGEDVERTRLVPTKFLGIKGQQVQAAATTTAQVAAQDAQVDDQLLALAQTVKAEGGNVDTLIERAYEAGLNPELSSIDDVFALAG